MDKQNKQLVKLLEDTGMGDNKQRERLYDLIVDYENHLYQTYPNMTDQFRIEMTTEHLLTNGVLAPPCKVGDEVYIVDGITDRVVVGKITNFEQNIYTTPREWITVRGNYPFFGELDTRDRIDLLLDKIVFLSREKAEAALAEREDKK